MGKTILMKLGTRLSAGRFYKQANSISRMGLLVFGLIVWPIQPGYTADLEQYPVTLGTSGFQIAVNIKNDDPGTTYNSGNLTLYTPDGSTLAEAIQALPHNSGRSLNDIVGGWDADIAADPTGEVNTGWSIANTGNSSYNLTNIGGVPNVSYESWLNTNSDANQDDMFVNIVPLFSDLDGNGNGWNINDPNDYSIVLTAIPSVNDTFTATAGSVDIPTSGFAYQVTPNVIPEPSSVLLLGLAGLGVAAGLLGRTRLKKR